MEKRGWNIDGSFSLDSFDENYSSSKNCLINVKLLITGSAGFIFSNFIRKVIFERDDIQLVSIDKITHPNTLSNIYINRNHILYIGDITDKHFVDIIFSKEKPDYVINGAANTFVDDAIKDVYPFLNSNILGTQVIIDACLKYKVKN